MKGDRIPEADHVARLCGGSHIREDGTFGPTAFMLRHGEDYLSVNWLEFLNMPNRTAQIEEVFRVVGTKRKIGSSARLAVLNVGTIQKIGAELGQRAVSIAVLHEPEEGAVSDPSHSGIHGMADRDNTISEFLARAVAEHHARS
jgi:hypothetical protein